MVCVYLLEWGYIEDFGGDGGGGEGGISHSHTITLPY